VVKKSLFLTRSTLRVRKSMHQPFAGVYAERSEVAQAISKIFLTNGYFVLYIIVYERFYEKMEVRAVWNRAG
jgi:hypothetical protein